MAGMQPTAAVKAATVWLGACGTRLVPLMPLTHPRCLPFCCAEQYMNLKYVMRCGQPSDRFHSFVHTPSFLLFCAEEYMNLKYVMRCVNESMRLYPHPPVLLRRAMVEDELPGEIALDLVHH